jgi:mono/diheme cytochrome c family protein
MFRNLLAALVTVAFAAALFAGSAGGADQSHSKVVNIPAKKTSPSSGKQMYSSYCAPCHGVSGKGDGPVGSALKARPADLTMLSKNNQGKFPWQHVQTVLQFGIAVSSHGTAEMPVWGPVLGKMDQASGLDRQLRISNLSGYLETIQAK